MGAPYALHWGADLTQPFFTSQKQAPAHEPEVPRRSDSAGQHKGESRAVGKQSFSCGEATFWPRVFIDCNWLFSQALIFVPLVKHSRCWSEKAKARTVTAVDGSCFPQAAESWTVCFFWIGNHLTALLWPKFTCTKVPLGLNQPFCTFTNIVFVSAPETSCVLFAFHSYQSKRKALGEALSLSLFSVLGHLRVGFIVVLQFLTGFF